MIKARIPGQFIGFVIVYVRGAYIVIRNRIGLIYIAGCRLLDKTWLLQI